MISSRNTATSNWNADQVDGQIAQAIHGGKAENFLWDDLALIHRGETSFVNEPYVTGGNPILSSKQGVMFNDMLGNTLGTKQEKFKSVQMTAFGETKDPEALYTGKPFIGELGYAFLFRNYRADKGKWLSADPLGYPDGWNNLSYVNNEVVTTIDWLGGARVIIASLFDALNHYAYGMGEEAIIASSVILQSTSTTGYASQISAVKEKLLARSKTEKTGYLAHNDSFTWDQGDVIGRNTMFFYTIFQWTASDWTKEGDKYVRTLTGTGNITLFTEDDWDFTLHNSDSTWETLRREVGPSVASNLYSYFMAGSHGQDYHMIGSAVIHNYSFSVKQYE